MTRSSDGRSPQEQLEYVLNETARLQAEQQIGLAALRKELSSAGIEIIRTNSLSKSEIGWLEEHFLETVFPVLTPLSIDPAHPFPFIPNLGFSIALHLVHHGNNKPMTALLRLPPALKRFHRLPEKADGKARFVMLEDLVLLHVSKLCFPAIPCVSRHVSHHSRQ